MSTLRVDVFACDMPCRQCSMLLRWVFGLLPSHRPDGCEFTTTDFPEAVDVACRILADPTGDTMDLAAQLHDRPAWQRGRSFNPNTCGHCGHQADWHVLEDVISPRPPRPMAPRGRKPGPGAAMARDPRSRAGNLLDTVNRPGPNTEWPKTSGPFPRQGYESGISLADGPGWSGDAGWWQCRFRRPAFL
ncbi:hypothetical protein ACIQNG_37900 [Streptomyces sp. NPDC091377]|uniref:hypothetical protein n=1 Tax=Streptomyces sp. NPDC091377 TaxID=3365995 RepID=UPI00380A93F3